MQRSAFRRPVITVAALGIMLLAATAAVRADEPPLPTPGPTSVSVGVTPSPPDLLTLLLELGANLWTALPL